MVFLVHVSADLFRVLAHACACEVRGISQWLCYCFLSSCLDLCLGSLASVLDVQKQQEKDLSRSAMVFLVHVCADLFRVLHMAVLRMSYLCLQCTETN